jgi:hypothetical protein
MSSATTATPTNYSNLVLLYNIFKKSQKYARDCIVSTINEYVTYSKLEFEKYLYDLIFDYSIIEFNDLRYLKNNFWKYKIIDFSEYEYKTLPSSDNLNDNDDHKICDTQNDEYEYDELVTTANINFIIFNYIFQKSSSSLSPSSKMINSRYMYQVYSNIKYSICTIDYYLQRIEK